MAKRSRTKQARPAEPPRQRWPYRGSRDPEQPGPDCPVPGAQLGQVAPRPDEGFLHDVIRARLVRAEVLDIAVQGLGVVRVQLADRGIGVAGQLAAGSLRVSSRIY
jgi:hypothetical protein